MSDVDIHHLSAAYALDALDQRERMAFEAHYPSCEVCRADVIAFRDTAAQLAQASAMPPPSELRAKVLDEVAHTRQLSPLLPDAVVELAGRRRRRQRWGVAGLAVAAALVAFVAGSVLVAPDDQPAYAAELEAVLAAPDGQFVTLASTGAGGTDGTVKVAWSSDRESAVLLGDELPAAPPGQAYELWLIGADGPVPMSVLDPASEGDLREVLSIDDQPQAWGVTIEPSSGSPAPTGDILYLAEV